MTTQITLDNLLQTARLPCYIRRFSAEDKTMGDAVQAKDKNGNQWYVKHLAAMQTDKKSILYLVQFAVRICQFYGTTSLDEAIPKFAAEYEKAREATELERESHAKDLGTKLEDAWASVFTSVTAEN